MVQGLPVLSMVTTLAWLMLVRCNPKVWPMPRRCIQWEKLYNLSKEETRRLEDIPACHLRQATSRNNLTQTARDDINMRKDNLKLRATPELQPTKDYLRVD